MGQCCKRCCKKDKGILLCVVFNFNELEIVGGKLKTQRSLKLRRMETKNLRETFSKGPELFVSVKRNQIDEDYKIL